MSRIYQLIICYKKNNLPFDQFFLYGERAIFEHLAQLFDRFENCSLVFFLHYHNLL